MGLSGLIAKDDVLSVGGVIASTAAGSVKTRRVRAGRRGCVVVSSLCAVGERGILSLRPACGVDILCRYALCCAGGDTPSYGLLI
jgi:hypothetical protein